MSDKSVGRSVSEPVTLKQVALHANVHVATASRALDPSQEHRVSPDTRMRVQSAAVALGYRANAVARTLRRGSSMSVGVVFADIANPFVAPILRGIEHELGLRDYVPLIAETHDDPKRLGTAISRLVNNRVEALIVAATQLDDAPRVRDIARSVPVVLAVRGFPGSKPEFNEVVQDDEWGAGAAVSHLVNLGHRRIAQVAGNPLVASFASRSAGYLRALASRPEVRDVSMSARAIDANVSEGRRLGRELLDRPAAQRPTGVFAHNDLLAVGILDALRDLGLRCAEDVSVIGYNDAPLSDHVSPPLSTIRIPGYDLGRHAARAALELIDGIEAAPRRITLAPELIARESTASVHHTRKARA